MCAQNQLTETFISSPADCPNKSPSTQVRATGARGGECRVGRGERLESAHSIWLEPVGSGARGGGGRELGEAGGGCLTYTDTRTSVHPYGCLTSVYLCRSCCMISTASGSFPPTNPHTSHTFPVCVQILLHDIGGVWIFVAACMGAGLLWNLSVRFVVPLLFPTRGGRASPASAGKGGLGHQEGSLFGGMGGGGWETEGATAAAAVSPLGAAVTADEAVRETHARLDEVSRDVSCVASSAR